jgi:hypothetical protein
LRLHVLLLLLLLLLLLQERANPQLLISSPSRRRRVAEGSGRSEQDVAELMGAFTQMKAQTSQMSKIMKLGQGEAQGLVLCCCGGVDNGGEAEGCTACMHSGLAGHHPPLCKLSLPADTNWSTRLCMHRRC